MLIINIVILLIFAVVYLLTSKKSEEWMKNIDNKENKLYLLYPLANWILMKFKLTKLLNRKVQVTNAIKALNITSKPELLQKIFWCNKISMVIIVVVLFNILSLMGQVKTDNTMTIIGKNFISRPETGNGNNEVELKASIDPIGGETTQDNKGKGYSKDLSITVEEKTYSEEELAEAFAHAQEYIEKNVLGNNKSIDLVSENLNFCEVIPDSSILVKWESENYDLLRNDGIVSNEELGPEGATIQVMEILSYKGKEVKHSRSFHIIPKVFTEEEMVSQELEREISLLNEKTNKDNLLELPTVLDNYNVSWATPEDKSGKILSFLGIFLAIIIWIYSDMDLEKQMKKRKEQMMLDYSEIINKFTLLINAGMTIKQAWSKVAEDYSNQQKDKSKKHFAYEEMLATVKEMKIGFPESLAYEQFGRRVGLIPYIKFGSLITQNLKKGNKGFSDLLTLEAIEAFEERKETAKRLGEEAGTKLLIPMMIMLVLVLVIIMVPAFQAFKI
ncbi:MAG: hypothetical protein WBI07_10910 [Mobilitalea sp.]